MAGTVARLGPCATIWAASERWMAGSPSTKNPRNVALPRATTGAAHRANVATPTPRDQALWAGRRSLLRSVVASPASVKMTISAVVNRAVVAQWVVSVAATMTRARPTGTISAGGIGRPDTALTNRPQPVQTATMTSGNSSQATINFSGRLCACRAGQQARVGGDQFEPRHRAQQLVRVPDAPERSYRPLGCEHELQDVHARELKHLEGMPAPQAGGPMVGSDPLDPWRGTPPSRAQSGMDVVSGVGPEISS